jgi:predicted ribosome quality control (RQC) complex YloA/Tae2 family protein
LADLEQRFKDKLLKDFAPVFLTQFKSELSIEYESFDKCVDEYFSQLDKQREQSKFLSKEDEIWKKMGRIREDQEKRI